jgi:hypothetical protein
MLGIDNGRIPLLVQNFVTVNRQAAIDCVMAPIALPIPAGTPPPTH